MKKFTFMLLAAFIAVAAMAAGPEKRGGQALNATAVMTSVTKQATPKTKAVKVQAPVKFNKLAQRAKAGAKKAAKKVSAEDLLSADWMLCSQYYEYNEEAGGLAAATPSAGGHSITFQMVDEQTLAIGGFTSDATETIQATFAMTTDEELLAEGIIIEATIADGQTLCETDYGPVLLRNVSAEDGTPIKAYIYEDGYVMLDALWADMLGGDGQYAGYLWSGFYYSSYAAPVNGNMSWGENNAAVVIEQDPESPKNIKVYNFAGWETAINVTVKEDKTFVIDSQAVYDGGSTQGVFYTYGLSDDASSLISLTGVGTENTLTFDCKFTAYSSSGYWFGAQDPATITLLQGEFVYPVIEDVAAVPANPEVLTVGNYDAAQGYGYISFVVPTTDVDGNDIKEANLFYQLFSDIEGDIQPIVFTPEVCEKLTEDMSIIPYTFTDNWDFADKGTYKVIFINYNFNEMYDRIGVKSIYTGGGETHESEVVWADVEKPEPVGPTEATFNFNEMELATSSSVTTDGDITEDMSFTESGVTLTITPKDDSATTPNRFWSTKNGPQLRVYSGTLTFTAPEGSVITSIDFSNNARWNADNAADSGEFEDAVWTGSAQTVVVTIAGNSQINSIVVTVETNGGEEEEDVLVVLPDGVEPEEYTLELTQYIYNNSGWQSVGGQETALVAFDGDDVYVSGLAYWFKDSYVKGTKTADGNYVFKANQFLGEDDYGAEYLVSTITAGEGDEAEETVSDFVFLFDEETRSLTLADGYTLYESGAVNDIESIYTFATAAVYTQGAYVLPDVVELPEGAEVNTWFLAANDSEDAAVNREVGVAFVENDIYVQGLCEYLPEAWVKGTIDGETATFATGQFYGTYTDSYNLFFVACDNADKAIKDAVFTYDAEKGILATEDLIVLAGDQGMKQKYDYYSGVVISRDKPDSFPVEAPEDLKTETYLFSATQIIPNEEEEEINSEDVTINFNTMEIATSDSESTDGDITESKNFTEGAVTLTVSPKDESATTQNRIWNSTSGPQLRVYSGTLTFEVPEGSTMTQIVFNHSGKWGDNTVEGEAITNDTEAKTATWTGNAQTVVVSIAANTQINSIVVTVAEAGSEPEPQYTLEEYSYQTQVGFDGNDVYFKGFSANTADFWAKGTLSEDGKTVTIPAAQYMGQLAFWGYTFDYFVTAVDEAGNMVDLVLDYDAETSTFTTNQIMVLNDNKTELNPYQTFTSVVITKMPDVAATPADPVLEKYDFEQEVGYNKIYASIPTKDVDGNDLIAANLFYIIWIEKDGKAQPYTFTNALYAQDFDEDVTEVPYSHDGYDVYSGGEIIYLEESLEELATWTKVGIQSIYYGGGERNTSNIVWQETSTGITSLFQDEKNAVIYNIAGQRVQKAQKGLYIVNGKKVVIK